MRIRRKRFRRAKFRDAYFYVEADEFETGRRVARYEYPNRDIPYTEDLGKKAFQFNVTGYVIGETYLKDKNKLIEACETSGPAHLIHPDYGDKLVNCLTCKVTETNYQGGIVYFNMTFVEAVENDSSVKVQDLTKVPDDSKNLIDSAIDTLADGLTELSKANEFIESVTDKIFELGDKMDEFFSPLFKFTDDINLFTQSVQDLKYSTVYLANEPLRTWQSMKNLYHYIVESPGSPIRIYNALGFYVLAFPPPPPIPLPLGHSSDEVKRRLDESMKTAAVACAASVATQARFPNRDEALKARDFLVSQIDGLMRQTEDDARFRLLYQLKSSVIESIPGGQHLKSLNKLVVSSTMPSLVLAYQIYGNVDREAEVVGQNKVRHPGFVPTGTEVYYVD